MDILRFITAGSVDDGKSTLIGRLLYDSKSILSDQLEAMENSSKGKINGELDLALLTDGLRAEREQGITIDVAYKYFETPKRKFIIADAPGHVQYTRNMITGASNSELIIILIDARLGIVEQTRRHAIIASLLKIPGVLVAINKMDLVGYNEEIYDKIRNEFQVIALSLGLPDANFIPISALKGDNVVNNSAKMKWYNGPSLIQFLENVDVESFNKNQKSRFQVQLVIRPQTAELHDYRGYAGKVISGQYRRGDTITIFPSGKTGVIQSLHEAGKEIDVAVAGQSITIQLTEDLDISRGNTFALQGEHPVFATEVDALLCWLGDQPMIPGNKYTLQHHSNSLRSVIRQVEYKLDVNSLERIDGSSGLALNEIARVRLKTASAFAFDPFDTHNRYGGAILVDETSHHTVAAVMFQEISILES